MLPHLPQAFNPDFGPDFASEISSAAACRLESNEPIGTSLPVDSRPVDHHCQLCPTCSHRLTGHRCKLVCTNCGYYLSCADYY